MTNLAREIKTALMSDNLIIVTHKNCSDGMGSVWALAEVIGLSPGMLDDSVYFAQYGAFELTVDAFRDKYVLFTDFSLKRDEMEAIYKVAKKVVVIDHHITAQKELNGLDNVWFDVNESGATLTYKVLSGDKNVPACLTYIKDRDLWLHDLQDTHAFTEGFKKLVRPNNLFDLDEFDIHDVKQFINDVTTVRVEYKEELVDKIGNIDKVKDVNVNGTVIGMINNHEFISEVGNKIAREHPSGISGQWFISEDENGEPFIVISLRGVGDVDVSDIAKVYKGGGHKLAAGFSIPVKGNLERLVLDCIIPSPEEVSNGN